MGSVIESSSVFGVCLNRHLCVVVVVFGDNVIVDE